MVKRESKVLLVVVFLLGCFASHVARTNFDVPPARAQTSPQRWEYVCAEVDGEPAERAVALNQYGAQGWEVASETPNFYTSYFCFKRPL